jgi:hypothetical protein
MATTNAAVLDALRHVRWSLPTTPDEQRQTLGYERLVPCLAHDVTAFELLDSIADVIAREPAAFAPDDLIATPERHSYSVWQQRPAHGVVADVYGWTALLTRGAYRPTDIADALDTGVVRTATAILGLSWTRDEAGHDALLSAAYPNDLQRQAAERIACIRQLQARYAHRLRRRQVARDAAAGAAA